ncbi:MFS transporter [Bifidobacterium aquikefiri]|uniref:MFS transporter n=1 Tax=Bifidobacterium aquikefiri TaxID=1653207 RepID=UPI0023F320C3|nr:MFS transporter [Bifidobacterium aquikefiri]
MQQRDNSKEPGKAWIAAWCFAVIMASVTVTTPLWQYYEQRYGFGPTGVSAAFGAMTVGVFIALPLLGGLSDAWGRFRVMNIAIVIDLIATATLLIPGFAPLLLARVLQGCAVALTVSSAPPAIGEALSHDGESHPALTASISTVANLGGLGLGSLLAAIVVSTVGNPFVAPLLAFAVLLCVTLILCARLGIRDGNRLSFHVRLPKVPDGNLRAYLGAGLCGLASFAAFSVYASLGPGILHDTFSIHSALAGPILYCSVMACSAVGQLILMRLKLTYRRITGIALFVAGFALVFTALSGHILVVFIIGSLLLGLGSGLVLAEGSRIVTAHSHRETAAASQAGFFMMGYVGMVLPIIALAALIGAVGITAAFAITGAALSLLVAVGIVATV